MKILALAIVSLFVSIPLHAANPEKLLAYEAATSSVAVVTVSVSTSVATLISASAPTSANGITWYSVSLFNITSSSMAYAFSASGTAGPVPTLTCSNGAPIGSGSQLAPTVVTEQFQGPFMWAIDCGSSANTVRVVRRGR